MTFILAFSINGVYDVTRRYIKDYEVCVKRRNKEDELRLSKLIEHSNNSLRCNMLPELIEFMSINDDIEKAELYKTKVNLDFIS